MAKSFVADTFVSLSSPTDRYLDGNPVSIMCD